MCANSRKSDRDNILPFPGGKKKVAGKKKLRINLNAKSSSQWGKKKVGVNFRFFSKDSKMIKNTFRLEKKNPLKKKIHSKYRISVTVLATAAKCQIGQENPM